MPWKWDRQELRHWSCKFASSSRGLCLHCLHTSVRKCLGPFHCNLRLCDQRTEGNFHRRKWIHAQKKCTVTFRGASGWSESGARSQQIGEGEPDRRVFWMHDQPDYKSSVRQASNRNWIFGASASILRIHLFTTMPITSRRAVLCYSSCIHVWNKYGKLLIWAEICMPQR